MTSDINRLLVNRIDHYASTDGARTFCAIPNNHENIPEGFRDISYAELARAIDRASWWLDEQFSEREVDCFAYTGPNDLRYVAIVIAAIKTGRKIFLPSGFLAPHAFTHLIQSLKCGNLVVSTPLPRNAWFGGLSEQHPNLRQIQTPEVHEWFNESDDGHIHYEYNKTYEEAIDDPVILLHTSGTTGMPKLITYRNSTIAVYDALYRLGLPDRSLSINHYKNKRCVTTAPLFHLGGLYGNIFIPVYYHMVPVMTPRNVPLSAELSDQMILYGKPSGLFYPPSFSAGLSTKPAALKTILDHCDQLQYGSAPLPQKAGDVFAKAIHVQPHYASTENPFPPLYRRPAEDWQYLSWHPFSGIGFEHRLDDLYELVITRNEEYKEYQAVFTIFPKLQRFATGDLWSAHPTKPGLWKYCGRTDDIIVLSSGLNVYTARIEQAMQEDSKIRSALVGGKGRRRPYLLLELTEEGSEAVTEAEDAVESIWPNVDAVNKSLELDTRAELLKPMVVVAPASKPFKRLAKGSVDRKGTVGEYEGEIEHCYTVASSEE